MLNAADASMSHHNGESEHTNIGQEPVWTYRGYRLQPSEFNTAMVHMFRAEIARANTWRQRLDTTTNWAGASQRYLAPACTLKLPIPF